MGKRVVVTAEIPEELIEDWRLYIVLHGGKVLITRSNEDGAGRSIKNPCQHCDFRQIGCHDYCANYLNWSKEQQKKKDKIARAKKVEHDVIGYKYADLEKMRRR